MTKRVESMSPDDAALLAITRLAHKRISCVVVLQDEKPVGIFTERDVAMVLADRGGDIGSLRLGDVMGQPVHCISDETAINEASRMMETMRCRRFPVVDSDGKLVGLVTQTDVLGGSTRVLERYSRGLEKMVEKRTQQLKVKNQELETLSITDPLTNLANRRYLYQRLEEELSRCRRQGMPIGCAMMDIDHFKPVNDNYGHGVGDHVLAGIGQIMRRCIRAEDVVARYGGEEFVLISQADTAGVALIAERIRKHVGAHQFHAKSEPFRVTLSCGVVACSTAEGLCDADELLRRADAALYRAKANGRNRTEIHGELTLAVA